MTVRDIAEQLGLTSCGSDEALDAELSGGIVCDLLSVVMSTAQKGSLWVTVQGHPNIIAVALMANLPAIIITSGFSPDDETSERAQAEGVALLTTPRSAFETVGHLYALGLRGGETNNGRKP